MLVCLQIVFFLSCVSRLQLLKYQNAKMAAIAKSDKISWHCAPLGFEMGFNKKVEGIRSISIFFK